VAAGHCGALLPAGAARRLWLRIPAAVTLPAARLNLAFWTACFLLLQPSGVTYLRVFCLWDLHAGTEFLAQDAAI